MPLGHLWTFTIKINQCHIMKVKTKLYLNHLILGYFHFDILCLIFLLMFETVFKIVFSSNPINFALSNHSCDYVSLKLTSLLKHFHFIDRLTFVYLFSPKKTKKQKTSTVNRSHHHASKSLTSHNHHQIGNKIIRVKSYQIGESN